MDLLSDSHGVRNTGGVDMYMYDGVNPETEVTRRMEMHGKPKEPGRGVEHTTPLDPVALNQQVKNAIYPELIRKAGSGLGQQ